ncbi:MAG TPA: CRISPR-associated protein Cas4, partial [Thermoplasmata archaeon]|nr:CRISPR-associated protein Cas4 [Thermoplasmata archaeon]
WVPVEWKSRPAPAYGPAPSHRVQVLAYCLLCEETRGVPPPFGILRYGDGSEFRIPWDGAARAELLALRWAIARPYDGRALPSPGKCRGCRWREGCDARVG